MRDTGSVARGTATNSGHSSPINEAPSAIVDDQDIVCEDVFEESKEAREIPHTAPKRGKQPTGREIEEHNRTHIPFSQLVQVLRVRKGTQPSSQSSESRPKCDQERDRSRLLFSQGYQWRTKPASVVGPRSKNRDVLCPCGPLQRSWS